MFNYLLSYLTPVKKNKNGRVIVIISGHKFEANTMAGIINQIESKASFYRKELSKDLNNVGHSVTRGNLHGRWDPNRVILGNSIKNLDVLEDYLKKMSQDLKK